MTNPATDEWEWRRTIRCPGCGTRVQFRGRSPAPFPGLYELTDGEADFNKAHGLFGNIGESCREATKKKTKR